MAASRWPHGRAGGWLQLQLQVSRDLGVGPYLRGGRATWFQSRLLPKRVYVLRTARRTAEHCSLCSPATVASISCLSSSPPCQSAQRRRPPSTRSSVRLPARLAAAQSGGWPTCSSSSWTGIPGLNITRSVVFLHHAPIQTQPLKLRPW